MCLPLASFVYPGKTNKQKNQPNKNPPADEQREQLKTALMCSILNQNQSIRFILYSIQIKQLKSLPEHFPCGREQVGGRKGESLQA